MSHGLDSLPQDGFHNFQFSVGIRLLSTTKENPVMSSRSIYSPAAAASLLALALAAALAAQAPTAAPSGAIRIGVVDTDAVLQGSVRGRKAIADLKEFQKQQQNDLKAKDQEIKDLRAKIADVGLSLTQDRLDELSRQVEDKSFALSRADAEASRVLEWKKADLVRAVEVTMMPVTHQVGKEMGYTLIFRKFESGLIYADDSVDITALVIRRMDASAAAGN